MADLTVQVLTPTGALEPSYAAATVTGDTFINDGQTALEVINAGGAPITVTIQGQSKCDFGFNHDSVVTIPNDSKANRIGPFRQNQFNDGSGRVRLAYSAVASVTVAAVKVH